MLDEGVDVEVLVRDPAKAPEGVEVLQGDITDPGEAAKDVDAVYFLWPFFTAEGIEKAVAPFKDKKIVYLSAMSAEDGGVWGDVEAAIKTVTGDWTFLRVTGLAVNALAWAEQAKTGVVRAPYGQAKRSLVHERDVAGMAVKALLNNHAKKAYLVTGPEALAQADQVRIIGEALGTPVRWEEQPPGEAKTQLSQYMGEEFAVSALNHWASLVEHPEPVPRPSKKSPGFLPGPSVSGRASTSAELGRRGRQRLKFRRQ
ncbi:SDR family oxidoreductase [Amycolatopsis sp. cmx-4-68]|uniref:SDR family oxidoreductase n=1 Tax=Amycolatopsis sp. cmx-4-68 TaxID=2790938 RepID=UPI00397E74A2